MVPNLFTGHAGHGPRFQVPGDVATNLLLGGDQACHQCGQQLSESSRRVLHNRFPHLATRLFHDAVPQGDKDGVYVIEREESQQHDGIEQFSLTVFYGSSAIFEGYL